MAGDDPEVGTELLQLVQTILAMLDPIIQAGATYAASTADEPSRCQQVWCPLCAAAALVSGEQHPLVTILAEHGVALLELLRGMARSRESDPPDDGASPPPRPNGYQPISVTIYE